MFDVFTNLAVQTLGSGVEIQPLIPPLFAPAPQLFSGTALLSADDQFAVAARNAPFAMLPSDLSGEMTDTSELEQFPEENLSFEKRPTLPELVPPDVPQNAVSTLSLRNLLHPQHLTQARMEPVSPTTPTINEPALEDIHSSASLPDVPVEGEASRGETGIDPSRPSSMNWPVPEHIQEASPSDVIPNAPEVLPSFTLHEEAKQTAESSFYIAATKQEPQHSSPTDYPISLTSEASRPQNVSPTADKPVAPLPIQPAPPISRPSPQSSEHIVNSDDLLEQRGSSRDRPQVRSTNIPEKDSVGARAMESDRPGLYGSAPYSAFQPLHEADQTSVKPLFDRPALTGGSNSQPSAAAPVPSDAVQTIGKKLMASPVIVPAQPPTSPTTLKASQERPDNRTNLKASPSEIAPDMSSTGNFITSDASGKHSPTRISPLASTKPGALHSPHIPLNQEQTTAKEGVELPPVRITIGRVVVRATPTAQPAPAQRRVLRPAQSLSEYLKQRERGRQ